MKRTAVPAWLDIDRLATTEPALGWRDDAACVGTPVAVFFPEIQRGKNTGRQFAEARDICARCPAVYDCLAEQMAHATGGTDSGVFGRTSPDERRAIHKALRLRTVSSLPFTPERGDGLVHLTLEDPRV